MDIDRKVRVNIGGLKQTGHIFGRAHRPAILFVHGGPGNPNRHKVIDKLLPLADHFLLCAYDQRGTGGSYRPFLKKEDLTVEKFVSDIRKWADYLKSTYPVDKIILVGESWGSYIGSLAIRKYPSLFSAYLGYGQLVSMRKTLEAQYAALGKRLQGEKLNDYLSIDPPKDGKFASKDDESLFYSLLYPSFEPKDYPSYKEREILPFYRSKEYSLFDKLGWKYGSKRTNKAFEGQSDWRLDDDPRFGIPYYVFQGVDDFICPYSLAKEFVEQEVQAPEKGFFSFEHSGHLPAFEEPELFIERFLSLFSDLL